jgi:hypothetical protein
MSVDPSFGEDDFARMLREEADEDEDEARAGVLAASDLAVLGYGSAPGEGAVFGVLAVHQGQGVAILRVDSDEGRELLASLRPGVHVEVRVVVDDGGAEP